MFSFLTSFFNRFRQAPNQYALDVQVERSTCMKVITMGDCAVGKTSIITTLKDEIWNESSQRAIVAAFHTKDIEIDHSYYTSELPEQIKLELWDLAEYSHIARIYYRGTSFATLVYDISNRATFEELEYHAQNLQKNIDCIIVVVGNKIDLKREVPTHEGLRFAIKHNALFFELTAKNFTDLLNMITIAATAARLKEITGKSHIFEGCLDIYPWFDYRFVLLDIRSRDQLCDLTIFA
jgi:small GTP-binding protein